MLRLYRVEWHELEEAPVITDETLGFLAPMQSDEGSYLVDDITLDSAVEETTSPAPAQVEMLEYLRGLVAKDATTVEDGPFSVAVLG